MPKINIAAAAFRTAKELLAAERDTTQKAEVAAAKAATIGKMGKLYALRIARDGEQVGTGSMETGPKTKKTYRTRPEATRCFAELGLAEKLGRSD